MEERRGFSGAGLQALAEIGFTLVTDVYPLPLEQLLRNDPTGISCFLAPDSISRLLDIGNILIASQVAINPDQPFIIGTEGLSYREQVNKVDEVIAGILRTSLRRGSFDDVDFGLGPLSMLVQLDRSCRTELGRPLYRTGFGCASDQCRVSPADVIIPVVGRYYESDPLQINGWYPDYCTPLLSLSLVAAPPGCLNPVKRSGF